MKIMNYCDRLLPVSENFIFNQLRAFSNESQVIYARKKVKNSYDFSGLGSSKVFYQKLVLRLALKFHRDEYSLPPGVSLFLEKEIKRNDFEYAIANYGPNAIRLLATVRKMQIPLLVFFHGFDASRKLTDPSYQSKLHSLFNYAKWIVVPSQFLKNNLLSYCTNKDRLIVIPYGIDVNKIDRVIPKKESKEIVLLHAGRLVEKKGVPDLVDVFSNLPETGQSIRLVIIGDGNETDKVKSLIDKNQIANRVTLLGSRSHEEVIAWMKAADIFILNSRIDSKGETEGFPNVILEAMYCECAVISTEHAGIPEILKDNENGILVPEKDNAQLGRAISELAGDASLRVRLSENAKSTIVAGYTYQKMAKRYRRLLTSKGEGLNP